MDIYDIMEMLKFGEGWTVEFKETLPKPSKLAHTIVAFANHQGGTILIGVNDMGEPVGFETTREHYEDILRAAREAVIPSIHYEEIKEVEVYGKRILAIKVPQGIDQVYSTSDGRYLVRENFENVRVDWQKLYQLMAKMERVSFEALPCEGAFFEDIDLEKVRVYLRAREGRIASKIDIPKEKRKITNRVYRDLNRVSNVIAVNELKALVQEGVLKQEGAGRSTRYVLENGYS